MLKPCIFQCVIYTENLKERKWETKFTHYTHASYIPDERRWTIWWPIKTRSAATVMAVVAAAIAEAEKDSFFNLNFFLAHCSSIEIVLLLVDSFQNACQIQNLDKTPFRASVYNFLPSCSSSCCSTSSSLLFFFLSWKQKHDNYTKIQTEYLMLKYQSLSHLTLIVDDL